MYDHNAVLFGIIDDLLKKGQINNLSGGVVGVTDN